MNKPIALMITGALLLVGSLTYHFVFEEGEKGGPAGIPAPRAAASMKPLPEILSFVPADTIVFFGGLEPVELKEVLKLANPEQARLQRAQWQQLLSGPNSANIPPAARMLLGLYMEYSDLLQDPEHFAEKAGVPPKMESAFYTVGAIPVLRFKLANADAFSSFIATAEQLAGVTSEKARVKDVNFLTYTFDNPNSIKLAIAQHQGYAIISLDIPRERERLLGLILGADKPSNPLSGDQRLRSIQRKYDFIPALFGYIDHREIINGLTQANANEFGRMLDAIAASLPRPPHHHCAGAVPCRNEDTNVSGNEQDSAQPPDPLVNIRTPACRDELTAIADEWPQTVFGYTELSLNAKPIKAGMRMVIENTDTPFVQDLQTLRGHIPITFLDETYTPALGVAIGLNVDSLVPFVKKTLLAIAQKKYQCAPLKDIQQKITQTNPTAALIAATSVLSGLRGVSLSLMDFKMDPHPGTPGTRLEQLDGMITISAQDPRALLAAIRAMPSSPLAGLDIPDDGSAVPLPSLPRIPAGMEPKAMIRGNNIVIYSGSQSESAAGRLAQDNLSANGMVAMAMEYGKYFRMLLPMNLPAAQPGNQAQLDALKGLKGNVHMRMDFTKNGIDMNSRVTMQ